MAQSEEYVFRRVEDQPELERLRMIEQVFDPASRRRLLGTGLQEGWRCLEIGPGAGSIMTWMSELVGPTGQVLAVDLDPKFLGGTVRPNVTVMQGDVRTAELPERSFDLVHARYVLIHIPDYERALNRMLACLKPGGWLVLEEPDFSASRGITGSAEQLAAVGKVNHAIKVMYDKLGMDYALGQKLEALLLARGLQSVTMGKDGPSSPGGSDMATIMKMSTVQLREKYLATGVVTNEDLDRYCRFAENPESSAVYYATIAATGRKAP
jgi:SAM-dependent methyltransferase